MKPNIVQNFKSLAWRLYIPIREKLYTSKGKIILKNTILLFPLIMVLMASILFGLMILIKGQSQNHEGFADISKTESSSDNSKDSKTILFSGYVVPQLNAFDATINDQVLRMTESGNLRAPREILIKVSADTEIKGATKTREGVNYKIKNLGSGSGGALWELTAIKSFGDQSLQVSASLQTEAEKPYFEWAWPVIMGIKPQP